MQAPILGTNGFIGVLVSSLSCFPCFSCSLCVRKMIKRIVFFKTGNLSLLITDVFVQRHRRQAQATNVPKAEDALIPPPVILGLNI